MFGVVWDPLQHRLAHSWGKPPGSQSERRGCEGVMTSGIVVEARTKPEDTREVTEDEVVGDRVTYIDFVRVSTFPAQLGLTR